jgi:hypothetical protein
LNGQLFEGSKDIPAEEITEKNMEMKDTILYVAAMPVTIEGEQLKESYIRFLERKLILDFVIRHGERPRCNHK